jgi:hypothetical protein
MSEIDTNTPLASDAPQELQPQDNTQWDQTVAETDQPVEGDLTKTASTTSLGTSQVLPASPQADDNSAASRIVQGPDGPQIAGPVQVQNRVGIELRAKAGVEEGTGQVTVGYDGQKKQAYAEGKVIQSSTNVDGAGTGVRLGYADNGNKLGSTSAPNALDGVIGAADSMGVKGGFAGVELYAKSEANVVQQKITKQGVQPTENYSRVSETGVRLTANGTVDVAGAEVRLNAEPVRIASEQKVIPGGTLASTDTKPVAKATLNASITATDQNLVPAQTGTDKRNLPNGTTADVNSKAGLNAYSHAVNGDAADGTTHFHFQNAQGGVSNAAMVVPAFDYVGKNNDSKATEISHGWMDEKTVVHAPASDPSKISRIEQTDWFGNSKTLVPIEATVDWAHNQARNDPNLKNLEKLTAADLERANPGRVVDVTIPDGNGGMRSIKALEQGDTVNLGFATVEGQTGIYRAPDLRNGAVKADVEVFFDKAQTTLAKNVDPASIRQDGSVDQSRLYSKAAINTFNGGVEVAIKAPLGMASGASNLLGFGADLIDKGNDWLMDRAKDAVQSSTVANTPLGHTATKIIDANVSSSHEITNTVKSGTSWLADKFSGAGEWLGDQYYDKLGWQVDAVQWEALEGSRARQDISTKYMPQAQAIQAEQAKGTISELQANQSLQNVQTQAQNEFANVQQTMPERLRNKLNIPSTKQESAVVASAQ